MSQSSEYITAGEISKALGVAYGTARSIGDSTGTGQRVGHTTIYGAVAVRWAVAKKNAKILGFLGYPVSPEWLEDAEMTGLDA